MALVRVKNGNSEAVWINPALVRRVRDSTTGTVIEFADGDQLGSILAASAVARLLSSPPARPNP